MAESQKIDFGISKQDLAALVEGKDVHSVGKLGGIEAIAHLLRTDVRHGLYQDEATDDYAVRKKVLGTNTYPAPPSKGFLRLLWDALQDTTLRILIVAGIVSLILGIFFHEDNSSNVCDSSESSSSESGGVPGWVEGTAILIAVALSAGVSSVNDYSKERQFRSLNDVKNNRMVKVIRNGVQTQISIYDVLVGDLVVLFTGDQIPADGLFVEGSDLENDESVMTGETEPVKKNTEHPFMLSGCQVLNGVGKMMVIAVGELSEWGQTMSRLAEDNETETPLQKKLAHTAKTIGKIGMAAALLTFSALMIKWGIAIASCGGFKYSYLTYIMDYFILAVTIIVVAVPEGLPLAVTISLAYSMKRMMKDNNLVRHLEACETMGGATNICSDKTGTLTMNRMTVTQCFFADKFYSAVPPPTEFTPEFLDLLNEAIAVNSLASVGKKANGEPDFVGNRTECAMIMMTMMLGKDYQSIREANPHYRLYPFSSASKRMSAIIKKNGGFRIYTKGASEAVLELCSSKVSQDLTVQPLSLAEKETLTQKLTEMASSGLRTLCIAYNDFKTDGGAAWKDAPDHNLIFIGLVGIKDPVRPEVPEAVLKCKQAGITVRMVTGDNILTAKHIARECGILTDGIAMEGPEFRKLPVAQMDSILPKLQVLARSSPNDKFVLVNRLKSLGEVVAVTGDGTNDAPALKEADVGFAMGISGTEVAKEASDVILMDDNFTSIVKAVMWGRCVFDNIRKFVQFQLTVNVVALCIAFVSAVTDGSRPLKPVQLLWVNLIMDTMGALALGTESPTPALLDRKPYGRQEPLISRHMLRNIIGQAVYQMAVLFTLLYLGETLLAGEIAKYAGTTYETIYGSEIGKTVVHTTLFNAFVFCQVANEINSRKIYDELNVFDGFFQNWMFLSIIIITCAFQTLIIFFGNVWFDVVPLTGICWAISIGLGLISIPIGFFIRLIPVGAAHPKAAKDTHTQTVEIQTVLTLPPVLSKAALTMLDQLLDINVRRDSLSIVSSDPAEAEADQKKRYVKLA